MLPVGLRDRARADPARVPQPGPSHADPAADASGSALVARRRASGSCFGPNPLAPDTPIRGAIEMFGVFLPNYRLFLIVLGAVVIAAVALVVYRTSARRDGARGRLRPQHGGVARRAGVGGLRRRPSRSASRWRASRASCWRRSIPVFPTMGHDFIVMAFAVVIVGGMGASSAPSSRACC